MTSNYRMPSWSSCCCLSVLLMSLVGCQPTSGPELISARVEGVVEDGLGEKDRIILVLDTAVELPQRPRLGLILKGANGSEQYSIERGEARNVLIVEIESGLDHLVSPAGTSSDGWLSLSLDLGLIGLLDEDGAPLHGIVGPIGLDFPAPDPALLIEARWVDSDRSSTVNQEDLLILRWDQPVQFSEAIQARQLEISSSLIRLSVTGDQLGTAGSPARFLDGPFSNETRILLGESPSLTIDGVHEHGRSNFEGSPSGIFVGGTTILPTSDLVTEQGGGVASPVVVDIDGDCAPWQELELPAGLPALDGHTLTRLPDGKVLVAGGRSMMAGSAGRVLASGWIIDPMGNHLGPLAMQSPRWGHCATLLPGRDKQEGTADDVVLITGGYDGAGARDDSEVLLLQGNPPEFIPVDSDTPSSPRFEHSAHPLGNLNTVILVAGRLDGKLNGVVEQIELQLTDTNTGPKAQSITHQVGELRFPRHQHGSILFEDSEQPLLLLYGGYGGSLGTPHVQYDAEHCRVIDSPEAFRIRPDARFARKVLIEDAESNLPGPRRGLRLHPIGDSSAQGNRALLVAGTRREPTRDAVSPFQVAELRTSYLLEQEETRHGKVRLRWVPAGRLPVEMVGSCIAELPGGRILIAGGSDRNGMPTAEAVIFDPFSGGIERICKPLSRESSRGVEMLLAPQAVSLWGGALIVAASPESRTSRALLFKSGE
ncbi:MAG: hypothetical protein VX949_11055 [Planctomycetota bacterium]|nr:hypothetical protein [Planctomycetota bacterium]